ncbi:MAG: FadR family transcriptional regulator [Desulfobacterales bacterium]|nr:FadR family transcriptional regulator [Desulfobacterales bacterium]
MPNNSSLFTPLNTKRVFEGIVDQVRELIYSGVFKPGDKLPSERELAIQFRAGRMVVREALRTLEQSGLIHIKQGSYGGAFIKTADTAVITRSISDMIKVGNIPLQKLTEARLGIEMVILEFAIQRIDRNDLDLLEQNIRETEQQIHKGLRATEGNINFHLLLAKASKNPLFEMMIESIMNVTKSFLLSVKPDIHYINRVMNYHKEILEAIKEKNLPLAKEKMEEHLLDINRKIFELMETSPS